MKVCHFIASRGIGRGELYINLANAMSRMADVSLVVPKGNKYRHRIDPAIQVIEYSAANSRYNPLLWLELIGIFRARKADIINTHFAKATEIFRIVNRVLRRPYVATKHNPRKGRVFEKVAHVIGVSALCVASVRKGGAKKINIGVELEDVPPGTEVRLPGEPFQVAAIGRLDAIKGFEHLIASLADVHRHVRLDIIGEGPERDALQTLIEKRGLAERVRLVGFRDDIPQAIAAADLMVISSLSEGGPTVGLEILFYGKTMISTDVGFMTEILPPHCIGGREDFAAKINEVADNHQKFCDEFAEIRRLKRDQYSIENIAAEHLAHYRELIAQSPQ